MGFINKCLYNSRLRRLQECLQKFKNEKGMDYQTAILKKMKNGYPVYLVLCTSSEDGQVYVGCIHVVTTKGSDRGLTYLVVTDECKYIKIGDIRHETLNQGIGTQMLIILDEIANEYSIYKITAWLSPKDLETHRERLLHFYEKNGYELTQGKDTDMNIEGLIATKYLRECNQHLKHTKTAAKAAVLASISS